MKTDIFFRSSLMFLAMTNAAASFHSDSLLEAIFSMVVAACFIATVETHRHLKRPTGNQDHATQN